MADRISSIANAISGGSAIIDSTLISRLSNVATEISSIQSKLTTAGLTDLAASLDDFDHSAISSLSAHMANSQSTIVSAMSEFSSIKSFNPAASVADAFGPALRARGMASALENLDTMLDSETIDADALEDITARVSQISALPAQVSGIIDQANDFFVQGRSAAANAVQATQIVSMFDNLDLKIVLGSIASDAFLAVLKSDDE